MEKHIILADNLLKNRYAYINDMDMERCKIYYDKPIDFNISPNGDNEWIFMRTRMGYLISLYIAYENTGKIKYIDKLYEIIDEYIEYNKVLKYMLCTRTLDIAIQMENIVCLMDKLEKKNLLDDKRKEKYVNYLEKVCNYLFDSYVSWYDMSNWGLIQMASIYLFSSKYKKDKLKKRARKYLFLQINMQIEKDGLHYERSMTYHYQIVNSIMNLVELNDEKNTYFKKILKKLVDAASKMYYPNMMQINNGDSDEMNVSRILKKAYKLLGKSFANKNHISLFKESGYFSMKYDDFALSSYLEKMSSGHIHLDLAHFNLYYKGYIFVDNGRYTYNENTIRYELKDVYSHNGIVIDNTPYTEIINSWEYSNNYPKINNIEYKKLSKDVYFVVMTYFDVKNNSYVERKFLIVEKNVLIFTNVYSKGSHSVMLNFNLHPKVEIKKIKSNEYLLNDLIFKGENLKLAKSIYSKEYNIKTKSSKIVQEHMFIDSIYLVNSVLEKNVSLKELKITRNGKDVNLDYVKGYLIETQKKKYTIFIRNKDEYIGTNAYYIKNIPFYKDIVVKVREI